MDNTQNSQEPHEDSKEISLGSLLRTSREERHIDLDAVVKATKVRRHYLEALENEEWETLPSQVFVKGFLRSYAQFLGLDTKTVLDYYQKAAPRERYQPHALQSIDTRSTMWRRIITISLLVLALIGAIIYLRANGISIIGQAFRYLDTQSVTEQREVEIEREDVKIPDEEAAEAVFTGQAEIEDEQGEEIAPVTQGESAQDAVLAPEEGAVVTEAAEEQPLSPRFVLTATVIARTWLSIAVDDEPVKEYLF
ncbi:MAG: helix-turn-helix domain-containing protein, partial [Deltaproteobacteria bacterium]